MWEHPTFLVTNLPHKSFLSPTPVSVPRTASGSSHFASQHLSISLLITLFSTLNQRTACSKRWLSEWRIAIKVSKSSAIMYACQRGFIQTQPETLWGTSPMGGHNLLSEGEPRYTTHLVTSHRSGQEEGYSKYGYAGSAPEWEECSLRRKQSPAI